MLFTLSHSPSHCDLPALLRLTTPDDALLMMQDGVLAGLKDSIHLDLLLNAPISLYALQDDVEARGLYGHISHNVTLISYTRFVELTERHLNQMSW